jgi:DNA-binding beta-propeller fold protein YncE
MSMAFSTRRIVFGAALLTAAVPFIPLRAQGALGQVAAYEVSDSILVDKVEGRWFYLDVVNRRLFGAGNAVVEIDQGRVVGHIADSTPGTIYFATAEAERGLTNTGIVFNPVTGALGEHLPIHGSGIAYDQVTRRVFLLGDTLQAVNLAPYLQAMPMVQRGRMGGMGGGYGGMNAPTTNNRRDTAIRRLAPVRLTATIAGELALGDAAVSGVADGRARVFLALQHRDSIAIVDADKLKVIGGRPIPGCKGPTALAIDNVHDRLFVACESSLVVLSESDGHVSGQVPISGHPTQMAFDPGAGLLFIPAGDQGVIVVHEQTPEQYAVVQTLTDPRIVGATALVADPTTHRVFVPHREADGTFRFAILSPKFD